MSPGSFYHSARHNADNVYHWIDDCGHGSRIQERCYIVECSPPKERYCSMCQNQSPLEEPTSNVLPPEPAARGRNRVKGWLVSAAIWAGIIAGFTLTLLGIQSPPGIRRSPDCCGNLAYVRGVAGAKQTPRDAHKGILESALQGSGSLLAIVQCDGLDLHDHR